MDFKSTLLSLFVQFVAPPLLTAAAALVVTLLGLATLYLKKKFAGNLAFDVIARATEVMKNVVAHAEVELRPDIQNATADGVLTEEEGSALKAKTLEIFKKEFGEQGMAQLKEAVGGGVEVFLSGLVERALVGLKASVAAAEPAVPQ